MPQNSTHTCESKPFMTLGDDNLSAPALHYDMPQKNCLPLVTARSIIVPEKYFRPEVLRIPEDAFWKALRDKSLPNIKKLFLEELQSNSNHFIDNRQTLQRSVLPIVFYDSSTKSSTQYQTSTGEMASVVALLGNTKECKYTTQVAHIVEKVPIETASTTAKAKKTTFREVPIQKEINVLRIPANLAIELDINAICEKLAQGYKILCTRKPTGRVAISYFPRTREKCNARFYVKFELMQCSYLGRYGAGETVNTFSLLPGEKTTIALRTYKHSASTRSRSENVVDSVSDSSIESFEQQLSEQNGTQSDSSSQDSVVNPGMQTHVNTGWLIGAIYDAGVSEETPTTSNVTINHLSNVSSTVSNAISQSVSQSNQFREVAINTSSLEETAFGEESSIIREIENINLSRTLNFVFRRLLQEYITILSVKNVKFGFTNGTSQYEVNPRDIEQFVGTYILPSHREEVIKLLLKQVYTIFNYQQKPIQFLECKTYEIPKSNCDCKGMVNLEAEKICVWQKRTDLQDSYGDITTDGVILSVNTTILRTSSVIVDALLSGGEALDCYNKQLQEENIKAQQLRNQQTEQAISIIHDFDTAEERAKHYKLVFGDCCNEKQMTE